mgnify:CR=1 FL=1
MNLNEVKNNFLKELVLEDYNILKKDELPNFNEIKDNKNENYTYNKENQDTNIINKMISKKKENNRYDNIILKKNIKYGIDETGNPIDVNQYYKNINNKIINKKRLVAYIIKDENNKNILIDLNGNKIIRNKEGDYEFPFQLKLLIKEFDVKHPELRLTGERIYNFDDDLKVDKPSPTLNQISDTFNNMCDNDKIKITNLVKDDPKINPLENKERLIEEISLQIDSAETNDNTSLRVTNSSNNIINYIYKNNLVNKTEINDIWKLRYGKYNFYNNHRGMLKNEEKKMNSYDKNLINCSYNKSKNSIFNNQEIISRTNSILNMNKSNDNILFCNNYNINTINNLTQSYNQSKNLKNKFLNNKNNYSSQKKANHSPIKNKIRYSQNRNNTTKSNNLINNDSFLNTYTNQNNSYLKYSYMNNGMALPTFITSPSLFIYKNKLNRVLSGFKNRLTTGSINSNRNSENYTYRDRVKNKLIDKNKLVQLNNIIKENQKKCEYFIRKNDMKTEEKFNKNLYKYNISDKENIIHKKNLNAINKLRNNKKKFQKTRNSQIPSSIRTIEFSENSLKENNETFIGKNYGENKNINTDINKLISKIPINQKKLNKNNNNYSVLTKEASNMIKNYLSKKNKVKKRIMHMKSLSNKSEANNNITSRFFNIRNKSFN